MDATCAVYMARNTVAQGDVVVVGSVLDVFAGDDLGQGISDYLMESPEGVVLLEGLQHLVTLGFNGI